MASAAARRSRLRDSGVSTMFSTSSKRSPDFSKCLTRDKTRVAHASMSLVVILPASRRLRIWGAARHRAGPLMYQRPFPANLDVRHLNIQSCFNAC